MADKQTKLDRVLSMINAGRECWNMPALAEVPCGTPRAGGACVVARSVEVLVSHYQDAFPKKLKKLGDRRFFAVIYADADLGCDEEIAQDTKAARLLSGVWNEELYFVRDLGWIVPLPTLLSDFANEFDDFKYPELITDLDTACTPVGHVTGEADLVQR